ncbi:MAG: 1-deoxy-D-xylulose-5-phosphate synthase [Candidatus Eisenbacteria bacterium]|uniref:1-deoxy-D-xylulose-5-phosphate synthase n=1 Tax=Eiseniibacteriota bacterium TaxID=2212470 RepID=A0A9D6QPY2_UNCEI|nr:1-deoxy-D-xylulose-5-phosphate synthase [Candidatus Eisenbacteria bacterium]MBI3540369.1 1-deoxy-D-xylulose-5-phosphate synthase [Candidatus Eisenbacteria bacterium]
MSLLERIHSPADLKALSRAELDQLAAEIRHVIIQTVARRAGHLAPNLGVVELTLALHRVFDSPRDKIIWDVGHQSYPHKLVTGRFDRFDTLRSLGGIKGYPARDESDHDPFGTCHGSTSISAALGFAVARDLAGEDFHVVAVIGDGALTGGMAFEGLNNAGELRRRMLVVLNDNEWSISPNVGAIARYLTRLTTHRFYRQFERDVYELLGRVPRLGHRAQEAARRIKEGLANLVVPGVLFEELGLKYYGPIDGHDLDLLMHTLIELKEVPGPVLLHVVTKKGKGYAPAESDAGTFHGVGVFDPETGTSSKSAKKTYTQVFGETAVEIAARLPKVVAVTAAMTDNTGLKPFAKRFPDRFFDVGMAEEHGVTFSAGLAAGGLIPLTTIYSTFLQRGFDQIIHDVAVQNLHVVFCVDRAGLVGEDGGPQHGAFDVGFLRMIPGVVVMQPRNGEELRDMLWTAVQHEGPIAVRYPRANVPEENLGTREPRVLPLGVSEQLRAGGDVAILALGTMVAPALAAAETLAGEGMSATVVNARFAAPVDETTILGLARSIGRIVTIEENVLAGGFGDAVHQCLARHDLSTTSLLHIGLPDAFVTHGKRDELLATVGLDALGLAARVRDWVRAHQRQYT